MARRGRGERRGWGQDKRSEERSGEERGARRGERNDERREKRGEEYAAHATLAVKDLVKDACYTNVIVNYCYRNVIPCRNSDSANSTASPHQPT